MTLAVITPSHAPDLPSFRRLHTSVVRWTDPSVRHIVAVPDADVARFREAGTSRLDVVGYRDVLPREFVSTTRLARLPGLPRGYRIAAVNARRPWPPVRGWILQQIVKLAVVSALEAEVALVVDSDVLVVRPVEERVFRRGDAVRLYRAPGGVEIGMTRHVRWLEASRRMIALDSLESDSPDYITPFATWSPGVVRACLERVETVAGMPWSRAAAAELDFSEFMLVGTFASTAPEVAGRTFAADRSLCHSHWDPRPLDVAGADAFLDEQAPDELAVHVQSNSGTSEEVLRRIAQHFGA
jgi:hypothetical protein